MSEFPWDNQAALKSFQTSLSYCHEATSIPIKPIQSQVENSSSEVPILLPEVSDESLRPLLQAWYYAGYYTGRFQAMQEMNSKKA